MNFQASPFRNGFYASLLTATLWIVPSLCAQTFKGPHLLQTGSDPSLVSTGDVNGDGKPDLVYLDGGHPTVLHVLLGNGDGTFKTASDITLPQGIGGAIAVADVNNDGKPDIVLTGGGVPQGEVGVLLGNGDGTFQPIVISVFLNNPSIFPTLGGVGVADFNKDGAADLAVTDAINEVVYILLGDNSGSFTLKTTLPNGAGPSSIFIADLNGDSKPDLVVHGSLGADAAVYLGNGDGTFQSGVHYSGPNHIGSVVLADMDGDGHLDMVVSGFNNTLDILHGNPDGTFSNSSEGGTSNAGTVVAVADYNGDGTPDIATFFNGGLTILIGQGHLSYSAIGPFVAGTSLSSIGTAIADFNGDGKADFAFAAADGIALLFGNGDGTFQSAESFVLAQGISSVVLADFTGDKILDIAANVSPFDPTIFIGDGTGKFTIKTNPTSAGLGPSMLTGDFNGDGKVDLFFGGLNANDVVLFGNGDGTFSPPVSTGLGIAGFADSITGDFNNDGITDVATATSQAFDILLGQSNETFKLISAFSATTQPATPAVADFNHDGKLDLVLSDDLGLRVFLGNGDGTFHLGVALPVGSQFFAATDLDGDGNADIVAIQNGFGILQILYGKGDGTFAAPVSLPLARKYEQLAIADMNHDGKPDIVLSDGQVIAIIYNNGSRTFGPEVHYLAGSIGSFAVGNLDGDGLPDIVVGGGTTVSVLLSQTGGALLTGALSVTPEPSGFAQPFTISLNIGSASGAGTPGGDVTFSVDGVPLTTVPVTGKTVTFSPADTSGFALGQHIVSAHYRGDGTFLPGVFTTLHNVVPVVHPTNTNLAAAPNPVIASHTVTFTATVTSPGPTPTGTVTFRDGTTTLGTATLNNSGVAIFDTSLLSGGTHSITAEYLGDVNSAPSTSAPVSEVVNTFSTTTTVMVTPSSPTAGATVTLTATVTSASGTPTGAVVFSDGTVKLAAQPLDAAGIAVDNVVFSTSGTHSIVAAYQANASFAASQSAPTTVVVSGPTSQQPSSTALLVTPDPNNSDGVVLTATVKSARGIPRGRVVFFEGLTMIGEAQLDASGTASFSTPSLSPGNHYMIAMFVGNSVFSPSAGSSLASLRNPNAPDFSLGLSASSATIQGGQTATVEITVSAINGFNQPVLLACASGSPNLSCAFQPSSIMGAGKSKLTITMLSFQSVALLSSPAPTLPSGVFVVLTAVCFVLAGTPRNLRSRITLSFIGLLCLGLALGCGSQPTSTPSSFSITVIGTSTQSGASVVHSAQFQMVVEPD